MGTKTRFRLLVFLACAFFTFTRAAQAQLPLVIEPKVFENATTVTLTVRSNGAFNLSGITKREVRFGRHLEEPFEQSDVELVNVSATARTLTVTGSIPDRKMRGERLLKIDFGDMIVQLKFTVTEPFVCPASCKSPRTCVNKVCVLPPSKCKPPCRAPARCNEELKRCETER